jgi:ribosomal protein S18 acetylase RimI-like enzyme
MQTRRATVADAGEILTVQRAAFLAEGQRYREPYLLPLRESLDEVRTSITDPACTVVVAELDGDDVNLDGTPARAGRLVGSGRLSVDGDVAHVSRIAVAPDRQGSGVGSAVLRALHEAVPVGVLRTRLRTGAGSQGNIDWYGRAGYTRVGHSEDELGVELTFMERPAG